MYWKSPEAKWWLNCQILTSILDFGFWFQASKQKSREVAWTSLARVFVNIPIEVYTVIVVAIFSWPRLNKFFWLGPNMLARMRAMSYISSWYQVKLPVLCHKLWTKERQSCMLTKLIRVSQSHFLMCYWENTPAEKYLCWLFPHIADGG